MRVEAGKTKATEPPAKRRRPDVPAPSVKLPADQVELTRRLKKHPFLERSVAQLGYGPADLISKSPSLAVSPRSDRSYDRFKEAIAEDPSIARRFSGLHSKHPNDLAIITSQPHRSGTGPQATINEFFFRTSPNQDGDVGVVVHAPDTLALIDEHGARQPPAAGLAHELRHAVDEFQFARGSSATWLDDKPGNDLYPNAAEKRAVDAENAVAKLHGFERRRGYSDMAFYRVKDNRSIDPTSPRVAARLEKYAADLKQLEEKRNAHTEALAAPSSSKVQRRDHAASARVLTDGTRIELFDQLKSDLTSLTSAKRRRA